ncbi:hypothetical protein LTR17_003352, partial [Elasticomyces elasticus]
MSRLISRKAIKAAKLEQPEAFNDVDPMAFLSDAARYDDLILLFEDIDVPVFYTILVELDAEFKDRLTRAYDADPQWK